MMVYYTRQAPGVHPGGAIKNTDGIISEMMKKYDTVVFDMDGTILDTLDDLTDSVNYVMAKHGYPPRTKDEVRSFVGNGITPLLERSLPNGRISDFDILLSEYVAHYKANMQNKTAPFPGAIPLLQSLKEQGFKMAVVSNKFDHAVRELNKKFFGEYIKIAIGESASVKKKPAPDSVFTALDRLHSTPDRSVYIGDSEVDIKTAQNAGLTSIGVTWGFRDRSVLLDAGADHIIDAPNELLRILEEE
jgi:phosphoglycolate phosphatase